MAQEECGTLEEYEEWRGGWAAGEGEQRRWLGREERLGFKGGGGVKVSHPGLLSHHRQPGIDSLDSEAGLAAWRRQQRQLVAAGVPAAEAMQPVATEEVGQGGKVEGAGAEAENLPPVHHKAWEAERLRALNGLLSAELQPEELLAPWKEVGDEESSDKAQIPKLPQMMRVVMIRRLYQAIYFLFRWT